MFPFAGKKVARYDRCPQIQGSADTGQESLGKERIGGGGNSVVDVVPVAALQYIFPDYQIDKNLRATGLAGSALAELYMRCKFIDQVPPHEPFHIAVNNKAQ
jgi:hypothetical protein